MVARAPVRDRELQHAAFTDDRLDRLADRLPPARVVEPPERSESRDHRVVEGQVVGRRPPVVPPPAAAVVVDELVVAAAERRRPQRRDQRDLVGGIVERGQDGQQVADLGRREDE